MAMSRSLGWTLLTTRSPIEIVPEVMFSSPASIRSRVDLPQPDGPTSTTNSPSSIGIVTPCRTSKLPNDFRTSRILTDDIKFLPARAFQRCPAVETRRVDLQRSYQTFSAVSSDQSRKSCSGRPNLRSGDHHVNIGPKIKITHKKGRVRCGRNHGQAAHQRREAQTSFQRMV